MLTFPDSTFVDRFLAGVDRAGEGEAHPFPQLVPLRDWSEPPRAMFEASGASLVPPQLQRNPISPHAASGEGALDAEQVVVKEEASTGRWFRKLYQPVHQHFHVVASELVCDRGSTASGDRPAIAPERVEEVGAVIRRLARTSKEVRWEDWVSTEPGKGAWVQLASSDGLGQGQLPLDPASPKPLPALDPAVRTRLSLGLNEPIPPLVPVPMNQLPPNQRHGRSTWFAYLPLASQEHVLAEDPAAPTPEQMRAEAAINLDGLAGETGAVQTRVRTAWFELIDVLFDQNSADGGFVDPGAGVSYAAARQALQVQVNAIPGPNQTVSVDVGQLTHWMVETATATVTVPAFPPTVPGAIELVAPRWDGTLTSVAGRWASTMPDPAEAAVVRSQGGATLGALLKEALANVVAAEFPATPSVPHRVVAAVLLWVRAHRILLHRALRTSLPPEIDPEPPESRTTRDPHDPATLVPSFTVGSSSGELEALVVAEESRATTPRPWDPIDLANDPVKAHVAVHRAALAIEEALADLDRVGAGAGSGWAALQTSRADSLRGAPGLQRGLGISLDAQPERGLLALDALHLSAQWSDLRTDALDHFTPATDEALATLTAEANARSQVVRPRFDSDHLYSVWVYARVGDPRPCHAARLIWSAPTEAFRIADHHDLLGTKPVAMQLPDLPNLLRDLPRLARAGAMPLAAVTTPPNSGYVVGEDPADTAREWGIAWICSFGIPVFTIVAWILFSIVLQILLMIPGFAWMLLLKICIPVPVPKGGS